MKKRPTSAVGYKRPISQYARVAMAMGSHPRYRVRSHEVEVGRGETPRGGCSQPLLPPPTLSSLLPPIFPEGLEGTGPVLTAGVTLLPQAENIMFLELDVSPPAVFEMEFSHDQEQDPRALHMERLMRLDSFLERPSTSKVRKSRSWSVPHGQSGRVSGWGARAQGGGQAGAEAFLQRLGEGGAVLTARFPAGSQRPFSPTLSPPPQVPESSAASTLHRTCLTGLRCAAPCDSAGP